MALYGGSTPTRLCSLTIIIIFRRGSYSLFIRGRPAPAEGAGAHAVTYNKHKDITLNVCWLLMCRLLSVGVCQTKSAENCCRQLDTKKLSKGPVAATTTDSTFPDRLQREDEDRKKDKKKTTRGRENSFIVLLVRPLAFIM